MFTLPDFKMHMINVCILLIQISVAFKFGTICVYVCITIYSDDYIACVLVYPTFRP